MDPRSQSAQGRRAASSIDHISDDERYRSLVDAISDYAIFLLDADGHVATWNAGAERIQGYCADEIIGRHFSLFYLPEEVGHHYPDEELARAATLGRWEDEGWRLRKDGSRFWANVIITAVYGQQGDLIGFAAVTRDMTERNELRQLQYASELAVRIEATREEEKKRIARELHDDLGQQLTALKMGLVTLLADDSGRVVQLRDAVDRAIVSVRRLAAGLRPAALDDLSLVPALEWLVDDFRRRSGLHVSLLTETQDVTFSEAAATALFRIVQEGLSNVMRHAKGASSVMVALVCATSICDLKISDDGTVAVPSDADRIESAQDRPPPSGLAGIRDRVRRLGGTVTIGAGAEGGFVIHLSIPRHSVE